MSAVTSTGVTPGGASGSPGASGAGGVSGKTVTPSSSPPHAARRARGSRSLSFMVLPFAGSRGPFERDAERNARLGAIDREGPLLVDHGAREQVLARELEAVPAAELLAGREV